MQNWCRTKNKCKKPKDFSVIFRYRIPNPIKNPPRLKKKRKPNSPPHPQRNQQKTLNALTRSACNSLIKFVARNKATNPKAS